MCLHLYGEETRIRTLQQRLRDSPLLATDVWTACRVRYHGPLVVTKQEVQALLDGRLTPLPEMTTAEDYVHETTAAPDGGEASSAAQPKRGNSVPQRSGGGVQKKQPCQGEEQRRRVKPSMSGTCKFAHRALVTQSPSYRVPPEGDWQPPSSEWPTTPTEQWGRSQGEYPNDGTQPGRGRTSRHSSGAQRSASETKKMSGSRHCSDSWSMCLSGRSSETGECSVQLDVDALSVRLVPDRCGSPGL